MRIAIDARLNAYRQGGIPQYTRQLLTALAEMAQDDQIISLQHRDQIRPIAIAPNFTRRTVLTPPHHRYEQWTLPLEVLFARPDVLHCPDFIAPARRPCPAVVTIHDLAFFHYPEILDAQGRAYYGQVTTNTPRADAIIAVSEATRQDIAQFLDIPIEQIDVIHEAAAPLYTNLELRQGEARVLRATPVVADTFMLFVSTLEPRKNLPTLLQALRICIDRKPDARYRLVIVGGRGWRDDAIFETVRDLRLADHVFFAGPVGQYDLRWLYNACRLYINPSLYEGFGLPLLEAMACGAACLAAATSSLPEIGGNAAIYIPPLDAGLWADAIEELWDDQERRAELGRLGRVQAQRFSWMRAARETRKVYQRVFERASGAMPAPARQLMLPEIDLADEHAPAADQMAVPAPGEPRPCLRCGAAMVAGEQQHNLMITAPDLAADGHALASRIWACPRCGHVELVVDWDAAAPAEHGALETAAALVDGFAPAPTVEDIDPSHAIAASAPSSPAPDDAGAPDPAEADAQDSQARDDLPDGAAAMDESPAADAAAEATAAQEMPPASTAQNELVGLETDQTAIVNGSIESAAALAIGGDAIHVDESTPHEASAADEPSPASETSHEIERPTSNGVAAATLGDTASLSPSPDLIDSAPPVAPEDHTPRSKRRQSRSKRKQSS
jgi:glycosyltransferase involved in cell wall biosynthesis